MDVLSFLLVSPSYSPSSNASACAYCLIFQHILIAFKDFSLLFVECHGLFIREIWILAQLNPKLENRQQNSVYLVWLK